MSEAFDAIRRSLPRVQDAVRLFDLVEERLGDRGVRDYWANARSTHRQDVQGRRADRRVPCGPGGVLLDYVPFYLGPRSVMLFQLRPAASRATPRDRARS